MTDAPTDVARAAPTSAATSAPTLPPPVGPQDGSPSTATARRGRPWRPRRVPQTHLVFWAAFVISVVPALYRARAAFTTVYRPYGDTALNTLLVIRAEHFQQLVGNYSRVDFHHPGPALFYILGAGELLFRSVLHVVPSMYNGQLLGTVVYACVFLSLATLSVYRTTRSRGAATIMFGVTFALAARTAMFAHNWFPHMYIAAFLLFVVAAGGVAAGRTSELPIYVLAASVLVHGHVAFISFVGATTVLAGLAWWLGHRRGVRAELRGHRTGLWGSAVILALALLPMVLQVVLHWPGPWPEYWRYTQQDTRQPRTVHHVLTFVKQYWLDLHVPVWLFVLATAVGVVLVVTEKNRTRQRLFATYYGVLVLQTLLIIYYVERGVDRLVPDAIYDYVGFFYRSVPVLLLSLAAAQTWIRLRETASRRVPRAPGIVWALPAAVVAVVLTVVAAEASQLAITFPTDRFAATMTAAIDRARPGHAPIGLYEDQNSIWPVTSAVAVELERDGKNWCIANQDHESRNYYTGTFICRPNSRRWLVHMTVFRAPAGATVLWQGHATGVHRAVTVYVT